MARLTVEPRLLVAQQGRGVVSFSPTNYNPGDTVALTAATHATLALSNLSLTAAGTCAAVVTNLYGAVTSAPASLVVEPRGATPSGLVAWWSAEGNGLDRAGASQMHADSAVGFGEGQVGQAFSFSGAEGDFYALDCACLDFGTGDFTVEFWVRFNSLDCQGIMQKESADNRGWGFWLWSAWGGVSFETRNLTAPNAAYTEVHWAESNFQTGRWYR